MAEYETALVVGQKRKQIEVLFIIVLKSQRQDEIRTLNLVSYSHNLIKTTTK
jgi:hypothetical protein